MIEKTCCFTGHRKIPHGSIPLVTEKLNENIVKLIKKGYRYFGAGGAIGFDTIAAGCVIELKKIYPDIRLILVLPCISQADGWHERDRQLYRKIKEQADKVVYISREYTSTCMHLRNRHLINHSSACICYLTEPSGGTAYTVKYAEQLGRKVINIADFL